MVERDLNNIGRKKKDMIVLATAVSLVMIIYDQISTGQNTNRYKNVEGMMFVGSCTKQTCLLLSGEYNSCRGESL